MLSRKQQIMEYGDAINCSLNTDEDDDCDPRTEISAWVISYVSLVFGSIFVTSVVGNAIVILAIYYEPSLRVVRNYFVASLAVADLLTGLIAVPTTVIYYLIYRRSFQNTAVGTEFSEGSSLYTIPLFYFIWASIHNLLLITFDRYVAVNWPLTYISKLSPKRTLYLIALSWFASLYPCIIPFFWDLEKSKAGMHFDTFGNKVRNCICCVYFTLIMIIIIVLHFKTYRIARQQNKKIEKHHQHSGEKSSQDGSRSPSHILQRGTMKIYWEIQQKAFKTTSLILSVFVITLFPLVVTTSVSYIYGVTYAVLMWIVEAAMFCSSSLNPFIYAFMRQDFNVAFRKLFRCRTQSVNEGESTMIV
ncbi:histamine H2 receptor-like [Anneissia japonica]|uniref:histamine H2 receptor-like n=1 Tax=Anneissia japonica TaxID=1529436 RepID=UPI001425B478|nr:histamine H2 receptor-like [Anneissia japonica]XP_033099103.1 histamine H2 receptor-like [Anneissia japonica]XP_033099104.1 histamine H2 receptor-like [Anneissia japonica]